MDFRQLGGAPYIRNHLKLIAELTKLLLVYGAASLSLHPFSLHSQILVEAARIWKYLNIYLQLPDHFRSCDNVTELVDEMMDIFSDILRYIMLAGANSLTNEYWDKLMDDYDFIVSFASIVQYTSEDGRSTKLLDMILIPLSANHISKLKRSLVRKMEDNTQSDHIWRIWSWLAGLWKAAIKLLDCIEIPRRLGFLACRAINRSMSTRSLLQGASGLALPSRLVAEVLFETQHPAPHSSG